MEHLRTIAIELQMAPTRTGVHIQGADFITTSQQGMSLSELTHLEPNVQSMLDELVWWARVLKTPRTAKSSASIVDQSSTVSNVVRGPVRSTKYSR